MFSADTMATTCIASTAHPPVATPAAPAAASSTLAYMGSTGSRAICCPNGCVRWPQLSSAPRAYSSSSDLHTTQRYSTSVRVRGCVRDSVMRRHPTTSDRGWYLGHSVNIMYPTCVCLRPSSVAVAALCDTRATVIAACSPDDGCLGWRVHKVKVDQVRHTQCLELQHYAAQVAALDLRRRGGSQRSKRLLGE